MQINQEDFIKNYIKPIQHAHRINGIIMPKDENFFFAKRSYFVEEPILSDKKVIELIVATFTTNIVTEFGFSIMINIKSFNFNYDYIYSPESEEIFI